MARYRPAETQWLRAAGVAGAYLASVATLFMLQIGDAVRVPIPFAVAAPPLVYAALSMVLLREASPIRRVSWIGEACLVHLLLGLMAAVELMIAGGLPLSSGLAQIFVLFAPAPALTLIATPLVLAPFVGHLTAPPPAPRAEVALPRPAPPSSPSASRPKPFTRAAGVGAVASPASPSAPLGSAPAPTPGSGSAPAAAVGPAAAPAATATPAVAPAAKSALTAPPAAVKPAATVAAPAPPATAKPAAAAVASAPPAATRQSTKSAPAAPPAAAKPAGAVAAASPPPPAIKPAAAPAVTAPPPKMPAVAPTPMAVVPPTFVAPPAAAPVAAPPAAAAAKTPAKPRPGSGRVDDVMVRVSFERVAPQLPAEAFVLPFDRLAESLKEPHTLLVPRRIVLAQMRDGAVVVDWPTISSQFPDLALGISEAEFRSRYPELRLTLPVDEILAQLPADTRPLASAVLAAEQLETLVPPAAPSNGPSRTGAAAPAAAAASATPFVANGGQRPMAGPAAWPAVGAAPAVVAAAPAAPAAQSRGSLVDRETVARIVAGFAHVGTFEAAAERVDGVTFVALVSPSLRRETVTACAARAAGFLSGAPDEVVTVRTALAVMVVAAASTPIVVATPVPGPPVALLELRAARAAAALGASAGMAREAAPSSPLQPATVDARVAKAGRALVSFGAVEPTVFTAGAGRVYVFSAPGRPAAPLGALATSVCEALRDGGAALGRLDSVVFRRGSERMVLRPLGDGTEMLAASGPITRPGRVHRDAERAAAVLEGR